MVASEERQSFMCAFQDSNNLLELFEEEPDIYMQMHWIMDSLIVSMCMGIWNNQECLFMIKKQNLSKNIAIYRF